jgi:two-component system, OmpR family, response regulator MtrA
LDAPNSSRNRSNHKARLLLLSVDGGRGAELAGHFPAEKYEVVSCPISVETDGWLSGLNPELLLLTPPSTHKEFIQTCETIRDQTELPIVLLSERRDEHLVTRMLASGFDEYLVEPIGGGELVARIEAVLRRAYRGGGPWQTQQAGGLLLS